MEVKNKSSIIKNLEYKTINSFNYIYKKATIKEKYENMVKELRALNYENMADSKMQHMDFIFLINSILKLKKTINKNNPYMKYIKYVKPYNLNNTKINSNSNNNKYKLLLEEEKRKLNTKMNYSSKNNEQILNFNKNRKNCRNFYFTRMCNIECKKVNANRTEKIILLQKNIRGFLSKKIFDEKVNNEIAKNFISNILIIQRAVRQFLFKKNSLNNLIIKIIKNERFQKGNKITDIFSLYHYRNFYKKNIIINKIINARNNSATLIQSEFKTYLFNKKVKEILKKEKNSYILTYPFKADSVQIKIYHKDNIFNYKIYNYFICPIRKYFIAYIDKNSIDPGEHLCHIKVNNATKIDDRYQFVNKNNILYNLISLGDYLMKKSKPKQYEIEVKKKIKKYKKQKVIDKRINDEMDNFYYYYYNDKNSNSFDSFSNASEQEKNKLNYREQIDEDDPDQVIDVTGKMHNSKINNLIDYNYLKELQKHNMDKNNKRSRISKGKANKNKIPAKKYDLIEHLKDEIKDEFLDDKDDNVGNLCQSQTINYNNILDELSHSSNSIVSNISVTNLNSYSKKTHKAKFSNYKNVKNNNKGNKKSKNKDKDKTNSKNSIPNKSKSKKKPKISSKSKKK